MKLAFCYVLLIPVVLGCRLRSDSTLSNQLEVSSGELGRLAALTTKKDYTISTARGIAAEAGMSLDTYGGTSREVFDFMHLKAEELGDYDKYEEWLNKQDYVHILDWHRVASDLDFIIYCRDSSDAECEKRISDVIAKISALFPPTNFYRKLDINIRRAFYNEYDPAKDHLEPVSNIPISEDGIEFYPSLDIELNGETVNLAEWGLRQFREQRFEFHHSPGFYENSRHPKRVDTFNNILEVLRWLRYIAERPWMDVPPSTAREIEKLLLYTLEHDRTRVLEILGDKSNKVLTALRKLQFYSRGSLRARKVLEDYGIVDLAKQADAMEKILTPLEKITEEERLRRIEELDEREPFFGESKIMFHRSTLDACQNVSQEALFASDGISVFDEKESVARLGIGLYCSTSIDLYAYGDYYVKVTLRKDAVRGVDFDYKGNYFVLKHQGAIESIEKVDYKTLLQDQLAKVRQHYEQKEFLGWEIKAAWRTITALVEPGVYEVDRKMLQNLIERYRDDGGAMVEVLEGLLKKPEASRTSLTHPDMTKLFLQLVDSSLAVDGQAYYLRSEFAFQVLVEPQLFALPNLESRALRYFASRQFVAGFAKDDRSGRNAGSLLSRLFNNKSFVQRMEQQHPVEWRQFLDNCADFLDSEDLFDYFRYVRVSNQLTEKDLAALERGLEFPDPDDGHMNQVKEEALWTLTELAPQNEKLRDTIANDLESKSYFQRMRAAERIGELEISNLTAKLGNLLLDTEWNVRERALNAIAEFDDADVRTQYLLLDVMKNDGYEGELAKKALLKQKVFQGVMREVREQAESRSGHFEDFKNEYSGTLLPGGGVEALFGCAGGRP